VDVGGCSELRQGNCTTQRYDPYAGAHSFLGEHLGKGQRVVHHSWAVPKVPEDHYPELRRSHHNSGQAQSCGKEEGDVLVEKVVFYVSAPRR